jgi:acetoin utilization deacetylase AcuC-like enzyme
MAAHVVALAHERDAPFGAVLEGGYDLDALATSVAATLEAFSDDDPQPESFEREQVTADAAEVVGSHWRLERI